MRSVSAQLGLKVAQILLTKTQRFHNFELIRQSHCWATFIQGQNSTSLQKQCILPTKPNFE